MGTVAAFGPTFSIEIDTGFVSVKRGTAGGGAETFGAAGKTETRGIRGGGDFGWAILGIGES